MKVNLWIVLLLAFLNASILAQSPPNWEWAKSFGGSWYANKIAHDAVGNVYITGGYVGPLNIAQSTFTNAGSFDFFIAKYDNAGNFLWARTAGSGLDDLGEGVAIDPQGNVFVGGYFSGGSLSIGNTTLTSGGGNLTLPFITKYSSGGNFLWAKTVQGTGLYISGAKVAVDAKGSVYLTCSSFGGSFMFDTMLVNPTGQRGASLIKLDGNGMGKWSKNLHCNRETGLSDITTDNNGNLSICGYFDGDTLTIDNTQAINSKKMSYDGFVAKIDSIGQVHWLRTLAGMGREIAYSCANDLFGNTFICGSSSGPAVSLASHSTITQFPGDDDIVLAKIDFSGQTLWTRTLGGSDSDQGMSVRCDDAGNVFMAAAWQSSVLIVGGHTYTNTLVNNAKLNTLITKWRSDGALIWDKAITNPGHDLVRTISVDAPGNCYVAGSYGSAILNLDTINLNNSGGLKFFVGKIPSSNYNETTDVHSVLDGTQLSIYPNPVSDKLFIVGQKNNYSVTIKDLFGKTVFSENAITEAIDLSFLQSGVYLVEVVGETTTTTRKLIKN